MLVFVDGAINMGYGLVADPRVVSFRIAIYAELLVRANRDYWKLICKIATVSSVHRWFQS